MRESFRLQKSNRLTKKKEYLSLFKSNQKVYFETCIIFSKPNFLDFPRVGITIKGKVRSVDRTRLKRVVREKFRNKKNLLPFSDFNFFIKAKTLNNIQSRQNFFM